MRPPAVVARLGAVVPILWPFGRRHRRQLVGGFAGTLALVASRLAFPIPLQGIVELAVPSSGQDRRVVDHLPTWGDPVLWLSGTIVALAALAGMAEHAQRLSFARFASRTLNDTRSAAMAGLAGPGRGHHDPGNLVACIVADSARVKQGLKGVLNHVTANGILFVAVGAVLLATEPAAGLVLGAGGVVVTGTALWGAARVAEVAGRYRAGEGDLAGAVHRALLAGGGSAGSPGDELEGLDALSGEADIEMSRWEVRTTCAAHLILTATGGVLLWTGLRAVDAGDMTTGALFGVVAYLLILYEPTIRLARQTTRLGPVLASAERLGPFLPPQTPLSSVAIGDPEALPRE